MAYHQPNQAGTNEPIGSLFMASGRRLYGWLFGSFGTFRQASSLFGLLAISAAGSLPVHLMPLTIAALIATGQASAVQAGWIAFTLMTGQLFSATGLAVFYKRQPTWRVLAANAVLLLPAALLATSKVMPAMHAGWFLFGVAGGVMQYAGMIAAARDPSPRLAFSLRLGMALALSGSLMALLAWNFGTMPGDRLPETIAAVMVFITLAGLLLRAKSGGLGPPNAPRQADMQGETCSREKVWWHLGAVFLFFAGAVGLLSFIIDIGGRSGFGISSAAIGLGLVRVATALTIYTLSVMLASAADRAVFTVIPVILAGICAALSTTSSLVVFIAGMLALELAINILAPRFIGALASRSGKQFGIWITAATLAGSAIGPVVYGVAIEGRFLFAAVLLSMIAFFVPAVTDRFTPEAGEKSPAR